MARVLAQNRSAVIIYQNDSRFDSFEPLYSVSSIPVVSAATSARPFCRVSFGIFAV